MAEQTPREKTTYVILKLKQPEITSDNASSSGGDRSEQWSVAARDIQATNADAAVKQHVEKQPEAAGGMYVAVPARSWQPTSVKVETQTVVKVGG